MRTAYKSLILSLLVVGCSSGAKTDNSANNISQPVKPLDKNGSITIAFTGVVPLVSGQSGFINIPILNTTTKNLTLKTAKMSDAKLNQNAEFAACKNLQHGSSCNIRINLPASNTSSGIELSFIDSEGHVYSAAQLIEFTDSNYVSSNGFSFNLDKISKINSTQDYLVTVPFYANQKFDSINVKSTFGALQDFNCAKGVESDTLCVASFKMPAGDYVNQIQVSGVGEHDKPSQFAFNYTTSNSSAGYLNITNGPLVIESKESSGQVSLVNIGDEAISFSDGLTPAREGASNLDFKNSCGSKVVAAHDVCTVTLFKKDETYTNVQNYNVLYGDSSENKTSTPIYYIAGKAQNSGLEIVTPLANLTNTLVGGSVSAVLTVRNSGSSLINNLQFSFDSQPDDMHMDEALSDCGDSLESNSSCHYVITYSPKSANLESYANYHVEGRDEHSLAVKTPHYISHYSAIDSNGNSLQVNPSYIDVVMPADGSKKVQEVTLANNGSHDFTLKDVRISGDNSIMSLANLHLPVTIQAGKSQVVDLQFSSYVESIGRNQLLIAGDFADNNNHYSGVLNVDYMISNSFAEVSPPQYFDADGHMMSPESHFELTAANYVDVVFHYSAPAGKNLPGFIINDTNIPLGFSPVPVKQRVNTVQCPSYRQGDITGKQLDSSGCSIAYRYVDSAQAIEGLYDSFAGHDVSLTAPDYGYQVSDDIGLRFFKANQVATLHPDPFVKVNATDLGNGGNIVVGGNTWGVYTLKFDFSDYDPDGKLGNNINVRLIVEDNDHIQATTPICGVLVDPATRTASCKIQVGIQAGYQTVSLKYKVYPNTASGFNSITQTVNLQ